MIERIVNGPCPDSDFCIKMGGCMSGCTSGPRSEGKSMKPELLLFQPTGKNSTSSETRQPKQPVDLIMASKVVV